MVGFLRKAYHFRVIARPPCGRGNLKAKGMASRDEAREQEPAEFQNSDSSRRDTAIALHLERYIIRPRGRISYAAAYIMQRSCISLRSPASPSPHFTCVSIFLLLEAQISLRSPAALRSGIPSRSVKDCRVGRTRPPRNDKFGRSCGKTGQFSKRNV